MWTRMTSMTMALFLSIRRIRRRSSLPTLSLISPCSPVQKHPCPLPSSTNPSERRCLEAAFSKRPPKSSVTTISRGNSTGRPQESDSSRTSTKERGIILRCRGRGLLMAWHPNPPRFTTFQEICRPWIVMGFRGLLIRHTVRFNKNCLKSVPILFTQELPSPPMATLKPYPTQPSSNPSSGAWKTGERVTRIRTKARKKGRFYSRQAMVLSGLRNSNNRRFSCQGSKRCDRM
jgi:hypothetical protein